MKEQQLTGLRQVPPDGGWGWAILFAAVMVNVLIPGTIKSFGVLYVEFLRVFEVSPTAASWMPALCYFLYSSLGPLTTILSVKYSYRLVTMVGGLFAGGGLMLSYFANSITYLYFSFGIMVGTGAGLTFPVTVYIVSEYFERRRGLATGLCISGSTMGAIIIPPFMQYLLDELGYRKSVLIIGIILLNTVALAMLYHPVEQHMKFEQVNYYETQKPVQPTFKTLAERDLKRDSFDMSQHRGSIVGTVGPVTLDPRRVSLSMQIIAQRKQNPQEPSVEEPCNETTTSTSSLIDLTILRDPLYLLILISNSTSAISNTNFNIMLPVYAVSEGYDKDSSALLLSLVSLLDLIGRVSGAALSDADYIPKHYFFVSGLGISGLALTLLPMARSYAHLAGVCALFGLATGLYIGTTAVVFADILGPERLVSSYGISLFVNGLMSLIGPPICNVAYESIGSLRPIFLTLGIILVVGTALWSVLPFLKPKNQTENNNVVKDCSA